MQVHVSVKDAGNIRRFDNVIKSLASDDQKLIYSRAINRAGEQAYTQVKRALSKQLKLPQKYIADRVEPRRASYGYMVHRIISRGGDIPIKHLRPTEVPEGVYAYPFGKKTLYPGSFMTSGRVGQRFSSLRLHGHVFHPVGDGRWGQKIAKSRSGVNIPYEMIEGPAAQAYKETALPVLERRIEHELRRMLNVAAPSS